ncbi:MAG: EAL domain-containing protein [Cyanobacteria bacterium J06600_6]
MKFTLNSFKNKYTNFIQTKNWLGTYKYSLLALTILIAIAVMGIRRLGALQTLELLAYDWMVNLQNEDKTDPRLLVVEITDKDIEKQNSYPLKDRTVAELLKKLQSFKPRVIGFDLYREVAYPPGTQALRQELYKDNVVVIELIGNGENGVSAPPGIRPEQIGFNDIVADIGDDVLRRNLMYVEFFQPDSEVIQEMYSFSLRLSLKYLEERQLEFQTGPGFIQIGQKKFWDLEANSGGYQLHPSETPGQQILINYKSPNIARRVTLTEVLEGKVNPSWIEDKIVLIGATSPSVKDILPTPYNQGSNSLMPGVVAHAQMTSQILNVVLDDAALFWFWSEWIEGIWVWVWSLIAIGIVWKLRHPVTIITWSIGGIGILIIICVTAFTFTGWIPLVPAGISFTITIASVLGYKALYSFFYDSLTGLPNRTLFAKQLKELQQKNKSAGFIVILCLDLDRFKLINDGLGFQAGDRILRETTKRLQANISSKAILARVGADEFAIAIKTDLDTAEAIELANQLDRVLAIPYKLQEQEIFTSASIGLVFNAAGEDFQSQELLQASHTAMYRAKASGKSRHKIFATKMHEQALKRLQLEADLNQAIKNQEFELYYQPIVNLKTGLLKGFEALIRWQSPARGFVSPGAFIPVAEETGLIVPMGDWILRSACQQMQQWREQYPNAASVVMSVNLSSRQFSQADLIAQVQETLILTGLPGANLKLEITESMVMDDVENTIDLLHELKNLNIKISMDDFGTGFSSFSYLHRFPTDTLKIDRSFVSNMSQGSKNQDIVNTIVILAHRLGMDVIAEGIETRVEQDILHQFNCEYGQGYFFAKPLSQQDATTLLEQNKKWDVNYATLSVDTF